MNHIGLSFPIAPGDDSVDGMSMGCAAGRAVKDLLHAKENLPSPQWVLAYILCHPLPLVGRQAVVMHRIQMNVGDVKAAKHLPQLLWGKVVMR